MLRRSLALALSTIVVALAGVASATADTTKDPPGPYPGVAPGVGGGGDRLAPRREGTTGVVIRRDGASAVPFQSARGPYRGANPGVAAATPQSAAPAAASGFDLGDAAIGAAAGIAASLLAGWALLAYRRPSAARTVTG